MFPSINPVWATCSTPLQIIYRRFSFIFVVAQSYVHVEIWQMRENDKSCVYNSNSQIVGGWVKKLEDDEHFYASPDEYKSNDLS